ncbi:peroxiredoxin [Urbifossiella limnaea]|uniref:thioredoxin-dependent peroxiredoxin n=1 Tax=Urbifossiella limnaea TaxID=2528023 RepID=A0A517XYC1_9BACT|nr:peroxiredoxin [Urbifossiella limnaea]QDU22517.1 Putative peroxiredoxin bcp [Urbifossiella limnaea]
MTRFASLAAAVGLCLSAASAQDVSTLKVKAGDAFPNVPLVAAQVEKLPGKKAGDTVGIADLKGKNVVVFFYPKALTKGCTIESCGFRDIAKDFPADTVIMGASADDEKLQDKFIEKEMLPYPLLCDTDLKLIQALGIQSPKGKTPLRKTFVVGKDGKIAKIYEAVNPATHPAEVLAFVKGLK